MIKQIGGTNLLQMVSGKPTGTYPHLSSRKGSKSKKLRYSTKAKYFDKWCTDSYYQTTKGLVNIWSVRYKGKYTITWCWLANKDISHSEALRIIKGK